MNTGRAVKLSNLTGLPEVLSQEDKKDLTSLQLLYFTGTKGAPIPGMKAKFKSGDIVRLVSGGPDMSVVEYLLPLGDKEFLTNTSSWVDCLWFDGKKRQTGRFPPESLERVKQEKPKTVRVR